MGEDGKRNLKPYRMMMAANRQESLRKRRIAIALGALLIAAAGIVIGFLIRSQTQWMASLGFPVTSDGIVSSEGAANSQSVYESIGARVDEVQSVLAENSLDDYNLSEATNSMLTDLMASTGDPYAAYYNPERYSNYVKEASQNTYSGVGVLFADYDGRAYAADVFEGSEAQAKGVSQGDYVVSIDGDSSRVWSMREVLNYLNNRDGEQVVITWMHPSNLGATTGEEFTTNLTCENYDIANVTTELLENVGYIRVRQITQNAASLVSQAVVELGNQGAVAFVLDLRDNPGGYLTQAVDIASLFINSGVIVEIETKDGVTARNATGASITSQPLVVIVNNYTSAAAEVLAAALQDNQRAQLVGQTTQGKGSVQVLRELTFGGAIRYTAAYYLTPLGRNFNGSGIVPNVVVTNSVESVDTQQVVAVDMARSLINAS